MNPKTRTLLVGLAVAAALSLASCGADEGNTGTDTRKADAVTDATAADLTTELTMPPDVEPDLALDLPLGEDTDGDCIGDNLELATGTDPNSADSDEDGVPDGLEDRDCDGQFTAAETDPRVVDTDGDGLGDGVEDANHNGAVDSGETDATKADTDGDAVNDGAEAAGCMDPFNQDTDGDGLFDSAEDKNGNGIYNPERGETDPCNPDTDGDGLFDGCEDADHDGTLGLAETDPRSVDTDKDGPGDRVEGRGLVDGCWPFNDPLACPSDPREGDTDHDGLTDFVEVNSTYPNGSANPRNPDSDGDGVDDGLEDLNQNGVWESEFGELDPTTIETYAGKLDKDSPIKDACKTNQLRPVQEVVSPDGDWRFVIESAYQISPLTLTNNTNRWKEATAIDDNTDNLAIFILSKPSEPGSTNAATELDSIETRLNGLTPFFPRSFTTWDGFDGRTASYRLSGAASTNAQRGQLVASIVNHPLGQIVGMPPAGNGSATNYQLTLSVLFRSTDRSVVVGTLTPADSPVAEAIQVKIRNLTNGTAVGQSVDAMHSTCELFTIDQLPLADFLFVIDDSRSMTDQLDAVSAAASDIFTRVNASFVDARWAVASVEYEGSGTPPAAASNACGMLNSPKGANGGVWSTFQSANQLNFRCKIKDPGGNQGCDPPPDDFLGGREYPLGCAEVAVDYVQNRLSPAGAAGATPSPNLQRPRAALIVIIMTDEDEYQVESGVMTAAAAISRYSTFFNDTASTTGTYGKTVPFAIFKESTAPALGGLFNAIPPLLPDSTSGNIDDLATIPAVIERIIRAAGGYASSFVPHSPPITVSMKVVLRAASTGLMHEAPHSSENGWEYDPFSGAMLFYGTERPDLQDDVGLSYKYFEKRCTNPNGCSIE